MTTKLQVAGVSIAALGIFYIAGFSGLVAAEYRSVTADAPERYIPLPELDKADYNARLLALAHMSSTTEARPTATTSVTVTSTVSTSSPQATTPSLWPVSTAYPNAGAILPFKRVIAYYGNFYSKGMGVLGEYPTDQMLAMLASTTERWTAADPSTPAIQAIHYIAV